MLPLLHPVLRFVSIGDIPHVTCAQQRSENLQEDFPACLTPGWVAAGRLSDVGLDISSFSFS